MSGCLHFTKSFFFFNMCKLCFSFRSSRHKASPEAPRPDSRAQPVSRHELRVQEWTNGAIEAFDAVVAVAAKQVDKPHCDLVKNIFDNERQLYHNFEVSTTLPLRLKKCDMLSTLSAKEKCFYQSVISKSMDEVVEIALATRRQASVKRFVAILYLVYPLVLLVFTLIDKHT